jgi:hypothetical protein
LDLKITFEAPTNVILTGLQWRAKVDGETYKDCPKKMTKINYIVTQLCYQESAPFIFTPPKDQQKASMAINLCPPKARWHD